VCSPSTILLKVKLHSLKEALLSSCVMVPPQVQLRLSERSIIMDPSLNSAVREPSKNVSSRIIRQISNSSHESSTSTFTSSFVPIAHTPETGSMINKLLLLSSGEGWNSPVSVEGKAAPVGDVKLAPLLIGDTFDESDLKFMLGCDVGQSETEIEDAPPTKKLKTDSEVKTYCSHEGCTKQARKAGLCWTHGTKQECSYEGCNNVVVKGGVCIRHGAKVSHAVCSKEGCTKYAQRGGLCVSHGSPVKTCRYEGCNKYAQKGGVYRTWSESQKMSIRRMYKLC